VGSQATKQKISIVPKSTNESTAHYVPEPAQGELVTTAEWGLKHIIRCTNVGRTVNWGHPQFEIILLDSSSQDE